MPDDPQVVIPVVDPTQPLQEPQQPETPPAESPQEPTPAPVPQTDVDEFGVPWKNRAMEAQRKLGDLTERLPQLIDEKLKSIQQPQTPQYTYEQLEVFKAQQQMQLGTDPQAANNIAWATREQRNLAQAENSKMFRDIVGERDKQYQVEQQKASALTYVKNTYPEAFGKDGNWDFNHPLTQNIRGLMQNPDLANNPNGLAAAADIAYGRVARSQTPVIQRQVQQAKADLKQVQKQSLTEGAGRRVTQSDGPPKTAMENLRKTGSTQDASKAIGEILKARGMLLGE